MSITQMRSLKNTWQCAVSNVFHVTGAAVQFICSVTDNNHPWMLLLLTNVLDF